MTNVGLFGLPGSGKSTIFKALTRQSVTPQFLGFDLKPTHAVVKIPDPRLEKISGMYNTRSIVPATVEFVDIPGFNPASTETKLKNMVFEHYRNSDALALVVNLFDPEAATNAATGIRELLDELIIMGLITAENCAKRLKKAAAHKGNQEAAAKYAVLTKVREQLEEGIPVRRMELQKEEKKLLREYAFISEKQIIVVFNIADADLNKPDNEILGMMEARKIAQDEQLTMVRIAGAIQAELCEMDDEEAEEYMTEFGVKEPATDKLIRAAHDALGLITFLTGSEKECRAWSLKANSTAQQAAGTIHSDMARGFIRAETVAFSDFVEYGGMAGAKAAGRVRLEGKGYITQDGDILSIRFNV